MEASTFTILPLLNVSDDSVLVTVPESATTGNTRTVSGIAFSNSGGYLFQVTDSKKKKFFC